MKRMAENWMDVKRNGLLVSSEPGALSNDSCIENRFKV